MNLRKDHYRRSGKWTLNKPCSLSPGGRPPGPFPVFSLSCRTGIPPPSLLPASGASRGVFFRRSPSFFSQGARREERSRHRTPRNHTRYAMPGERRLAELFVSSKQSATPKPHQTLNLNSKGGAPRPARRPSQPLTL